MSSFAILLWRAHERAFAAETVTHYRCHAGLQCFAMPVEIDSQRKLAVIGGRRC